MEHLSILNILVERLVPDGTWCPGLVTSVAEEDVVKVHDKVGIHGSVLKIEPARKSQGFEATRFQNSQRDRTGKIAPSSSHCEQTEEVAAGEKFRKIPRGEKTTVFLSPWVGYCAAPDSQVTSGDVLFITYN